MPTSSLAGIISFVFVVLVGAPLLFVVWMQSYIRCMVCLTTTHFRCLPGSPAGKSSAA